MTDFGKIGLVCGLECHQQLDVGKLFCNCPSDLREDKPDLVVKRKLRAVASELGKYDPAALKEFKKDRTFVYEGYSDFTCEVEFDEEPPFPLNQEALKTTLTVAMLLDSKPVDEVRVMRKAVIDGSNTSGFQRTALVSIGGSVKTSEGDVGITMIAVEEDSGRVMERKDHEVVYRLDRLGIPLIEISTDPHIHSPKQAKEAALAIGGLLRATGKAKRGLGTIRQDVNVSIKGGARVEIKGVQNLDIFDQYIENEVKRQQMLIHLAEKLKERTSGHSLSHNPKNLSTQLKDTQAPVLQQALKSGGVILGIKLTGFKGLIGNKEKEIRFGRELAAHAKTAGVNGIFHSDELPNYGITRQEVHLVEKALECGEHDAIILVAAKEKDAQLALEYVQERAIKAFDGPQKETRNPLPDGFTEYARPLAGAARMYPETDVPPVQITKTLLAAVKQNLPMTAEERLEVYTKKHGLSLDLANEMKLSNWAPLYERLVKEKCNPPTVANLLLSELKAAKRDGANTENLTEEFLEELSIAQRDGKAAKQLVPELLKAASQDPSKKLKDLIASLGVKNITTRDLEKIVHKIVDENKSLIEKQGERSLGPLMGLVMKHAPGADGKTVSELLKKKLKVN